MLEGEAMETPSPRRSISACLQMVLRAGLEVDLCAKTEEGRFGEDLSKERVERELVTGQKKVGTSELPMGTRSQCISLGPHKKRFAQRSLAAQTSGV